MSTILEILEETAARLRQHVDETAKALDGPTLDELEQARAYYVEQIAEAQRKLAETEQRIADRRKAEAAHADAQQALAEAVELARRHRQTVEAPPAAEAIAATGLPVQPAPQQPPVEQTPDAAPETVTATTGGTPIIDDPDALAAGDPIVTAVDPVPAPTGQPRHAKPKARVTGPLRILRRPADTDSNDGGAQ